MDSIAQLEAAVARYRNAEVGSAAAEEMRRLRAVIDSLEVLFWRESEDVSAHGRPPC
jgi:hypothetical protein